MVGRFSKKTVMQNTQMTNMQNVYVDAKTPLLMMFFVIPRKSELVPLISSGPHVLLDVQNMTQIKKTPKNNIMHGINVCRLLSVIPWILLAFLCNSLYAQMYSMPRQRRQPVIIWSNDALIVIEKNGRQIKIGDIISRIFYCKIEARPNTLGISASSGNIIDVRLVGDKYYYGRSPISREGLWEDHEIVVDETSDQRGVPFKLYETNIPNLYFAINVDTGFVKNGEASCCSWWKSTENGALQLDEIIQVKWGDRPAMLPLKNNGKPLYAVPSMALPGLFPFLDEPIRIPGAFVLVSWKAGVLWVIKDGASSINRVIDLNRIGEDFVRGIHPFPSVILGIQPLPDGKILIAKRSEPAISETYKSFQIEPESRKPQKNDYAAAETERGGATVVYPEIEWIELDPLKGGFKNVDSALIVNAPFALHSNRDIDTFSFGFDPSGRLIFPWISPKINTLRKSATDYPDAPVKVNVR